MTAPKPTGSDETRPVDLDTGFWLWVAALPLMVVGYVIDMLTAERDVPIPLLVLNVVFLVVLVAVVVTFLILMRQGYRWTRTCLTGGAIAAVVFTVSSLFTIERPPGAAVGFAFSAIVGSVLLAGGVFLLHRRDVNDYFTGGPPR